MNEQPIFGSPVVTPPPDDETLSIIFLASLGLSPARKTIQRLQDVVRDFQMAGSRLVVITRSPLHEARDFVPRHHLLFPVIVDPIVVGGDGRLFPVWGVGRDKGFRGTLRSLIHGPGESGSFRALLSMFKSGMNRNRAPIDQLAAAFVVGPDGRILLASYHQSVLQMPDIDGMLAVC